MPKSMQPNLAGNPFPAENAYKFINDKNASQTLH